MKILLVHNFYQQPGGEDTVFHNESQILKKNGFEVCLETASNANIGNFWKKFLTALNTAYSLPAKWRLKRKLRHEQPDIVHVHNFFPLFSPSIFSTAKKFGASTVLTLHNYRTICPTALLMHDGKTDERSITQGPFWAIPKRVYKDSYIGTAILALMIVLNKKLGTWTRHVDCFIALSEFSRNKFIQAGFPESKVVVKPNFIPDPHNGELHIEKTGGYAVYVGRISQEKGINTLLTAWKDISYPLKVIGDGPLTDTIKAANNPRIELLGFKDNSEVQKLIQHADFLIMPSEWYEGFPITLLEAFANATPALVSGIGSLEEIVTHNDNGLIFQAGNADSIIYTVDQFLNGETERERLSQRARKTYLEMYTPEKNYQALRSIYYSLRTQKSLSESL